MNFEQHPSWEAVLFWSYAIFGVAATLLIVFTDRIFGV